ncbi:MAG: rod shape-determining protein [Paludibacteraceae bacterium]|nr:rod shape-determining protein [Paludibacteraceae bacterium]
MGLFSLTQDIAVDLGTANTLIIYKGKIVVDQPSIVAMDVLTGKLEAIGREAAMMEGRTPKSIRTVRPLRDGVIADFQAAEMMVRGMIKLIPNKGHIITPALRMVVGIPSGATEVERRAVRDSSEHAGGREVYLIDEPMAAALGIGLDIEKPEGNMVVDIGGGTTEIAVISLGGIVADRSIRVAGNEFTADILDYMFRQHNLKIGEPTAEKIKKTIGAALPDMGEDAPENMIVSGSNRVTSLPMEVPVSYQEIAHCLDKSLAKLESAIMQALEDTPPELFADLMRNGVWLSGGGAQLHGLAKRFSDRMQIEFKVAEDPLRAVARGTGIALNNLDRFKFLRRQ